MEWSNDLVIEFLELYEKEPTIWNPSNSRHKSRKNVHDSWQNIANHLSIKLSTAELKKKKDSLMSTFRKLASRVRVSKKTGSDIDEIFKPDWFAYEKMATFLHGVFQPRKTQSSETSLNENQTAIADVESDEDNGQDNCEIDEDHNNEDTEITSLPSNTNSGIVLRTPTITRKRKAPNIKVIENRIEDAFNILKKVSTEPSRDECSLYAELLVKKLRDFDENTRDLAMHEIDNYLYQLKYNPNNLTSINLTNSFLKSTLSIRISVIFITISR